MMFEGGSALEDFLMALIQGGALPVLIYLLMNTPLGSKISKLVSVALVWLNVSESESTRYFAMFLSASLGMLAYWVASLTGYVELPVSVEGWFNLLFSIFGLNFGVTQIIHGVRDLRSRKQIPSA